MTNKKKITIEDLPQTQLTPQQLTMWKSLTKKLIESYSSHKAYLLELEKIVYPIVKGFNYTN